MQNAKDSFYIALRNRLAVLNPARVSVIRGVQRPSILVEEAEAPQMEMPGDTFVLRWGAEVAYNELPMRMVQMTCAIYYATCGSQTGAGLDRGRALTEMDREAMDMLTPLSTPKWNYSTNPATAMATNVFWSEPQMSALVTTRDALSRVATVQVFAFEEASEA